jgi:hypothetical protein
MALSPSKRLPARTPADCVGGDCHDMFERICNTLEAIRAEQHAARLAIAESGERAAALEVQTNNLWQQLRRVEEGVLDLPTQITAALARHEDTCVGRSYVLSKIRTRTTGQNQAYRSEAPPARKPERNDVTQQMQRAYQGTPPTDELAKILPPWKLAIYVGLLVGAAVTAAMLVASRMGLVDLLSKAVP